MNAAVEKIKDKIDLAKLRESEDKLVKIGVDQLIRGKFQPRTEFDKTKLQELADSIKAQGIVQPIVARTIGKNKYEILAGERRWRAAQIAGLHDVPVILRECSDEEALQISLIENIQREDLNVIEEAQAYSRLKLEFGFTDQELAEATGRSRSSVSYLLGVLELEPYVQEHLKTGDIQLGHAKALFSLDPINRKLILNAVLKTGMTVRKTEQEAAKFLKQPRKKQKKSADPDIAQFENTFSEFIGCPCKVSTGKSGSGEIIIGFSNMIVLSGILDKFTDKTGCDLDIKVNPNGTGRIIIRFSSSDNLEILLNSCGFQSEY